MMPVRSGFGYRVILKYPDGSEKTQQKSGFRTRNIDTQKTLTMEQSQVLLD